MSPIWLRDQFVDPSARVKTQAIFGLWCWAYSENHPRETDLNEVKSQFKFIGSVSWVTER